MQRQPAGAPGSPQERSRRDLHPRRGAARRHRPAGARARADPYREPGYGRCAIAPGNRSRPQENRSRGSRQSRHSLDSFFVDFPVRAQFSYLESVRRLARPRNSAGTILRGDTAMRHRTTIFAALILLCGLSAARAGDMKHGFINMPFKDGSKYVLFVPHTYTGEKEMPLILFLHGAGERGDDGQKPVQQGIGNAIKFKGKEKTFPFFVIFPQAQKSWKDRKG